MENQTQNVARGDMEVGSFTDDLSAFMKRYGVENHVVVYTPTPSGSILSYTSDAALLEAFGLISARAHQIKSSQS